MLHNTTVAQAEPRTLRYRLLHVAARLTRGQHRLWLRIDQTWPWVRELATVFTRLTALPTPTAVDPDPDGPQHSGAHGRTAAGRPPRHAHRSDARR